MKKKQSMKHLMIFAAVTIICGTMALTSCSETDNALVVTDDKPWTAYFFGHEMTHGFDRRGAMYDKNGEEIPIFVD